MSETPASPTRRQKKQHYYQLVEADKNVIVCDLPDWVERNLIRGLFGFTDDQIYNYTSGGFWIEGEEFKYNLAGRMVFSVEAINDWQKKDK